MCLNVVEEIVSREGTLMWKLTRHQAHFCRNLITLNLSEADIQNSGDLLWLTTLADTAKLLQVLDLSLTGVEDVNQAVLEKLASRCNTLRLCESMKTDHVLPVLEAGAKNICHLGIGYVFLVAFLYDR